MDDTRRGFLKIAGISALGLGSVSGLTCLLPGRAKAKEEGAPHYKHRKESLSAERWGMVIDTRKLNARLCRKMIEACHEVHNVPNLENELHTIKWLWTDSFKHVFPKQGSTILPERVDGLPILALCNHCNNPPCVQACPTKATFQNKEGLVLMDYHRCIGCRFCMAACPYGARSFNFVDPRQGIETISEDYPTRSKGVVEKCNFCAERLAEGKMPACVEASKGALVFGDLQDENSEVRKVLRENYAILRKEMLGTNPSVYYII